MGDARSEAATTTTSTSPTATASDGDDGRGKGAGSEIAESSKPVNSADGVSNYSERLEDYIKSLELLSQHVGTRMLRQQRSRTLVSNYDVIKRINNA